MKLVKSQSLRELARELIADYRARQLAAETRLILATRGESFRSEHWERVKEARCKDGKNVVV